MNSEPLLSVDNLHTKFETETETVKAVDGISFSIDSGEFFGLVGESGSGKTVTALSIMQLIESSGTITGDGIYFQGENLLEKSEKEMREVRGNKIAMIFQDPMHSLNPIMTIGEQIAEVARLHQDLGEKTDLLSEMRRKYVTGTSHDSESWQIAIDLLKQVGIGEPEERAKEYPHQLSGGMRQRVMIAQALAGDPDLLIADEPTTALDVSVEAQILNLLLDLVDEFDVSVLLITHDLAVVSETCEKVAVMYASELMESGSVSAIFDNPQHPYTQQLLASVPKISDDREFLETIEGSLPDLADKPPGCPFRDRCHQSFEQCSEPLEEYTIKQDHIARCHLFAESNNKKAPVQGKSDTIAQEDS